MATSLSRGLSSLTVKLYLSKTSKISSINLFLITISVSYQLYSLIGENKPPFKNGILHLSSENTSPSFELPSPL